MDWWWWLIIVLAVAPLLGGLFHSQERVSAFKRMGDISGKPIADIIAEVGEPNSISTAADGGSLYQWVQQVGYSATHYAILVDADGKAVRFTHQFAS